MSSPAGDDFAESVTWTADGLDAVVAEVKRLDEALTGAAVRAVAASKAVADPAYRKAAADLDGYTRKTREAEARLLAEARAADRLKRVRSGDFLRGYRDEVAHKERLARLDRTERGQRLVADRAAFRSGDPLARARTDLRLGRGEAALARERGRAGLAARLGAVRSGEFAGDARGEVRDGLAKGATDRAEELVRLRERLKVSAADELGMARQRLAVEQATAAVLAKEAAAATQARGPGADRADARRAAAAGHAAVMADLRRTRLAQAEAIRRPAAYLAEARERLAIERQGRREEAVGRRADLTARYGRTGGRLVGALEGKPAGLAFGGATAAAGLVAGTATAGFQGTVQYAQFQAELTLLSRSVAGAFVPLLESATGGLRRLRKASDSLTGGQQQALAATTVAVVGLKAASMASTRLLGMGLVETGATLAARAGLSFGSQVAAQAAGTVGGQVAGSVAGRSVGAAAAGGVAAYLPPVAVGAAVLGANLQYGQSATNAPDLYDMNRQAGHGRLKSALNAAEMVKLDAMSQMIRTGVGLFGYDFGGPSLSEARAAANKPAARTDVVLANGGYHELGSTWDRATAAASVLDKSWGQPTDAEAAARQQMYRDIGAIAGGLAAQAGRAPEKT